MTAYQETQTKNASKEFNDLRHQIGWVFEKQTKIPDIRCEHLMDNCTRFFALGFGGINPEMENRTLQFIDRVFSISGAEASERLPINGVVAEVAGGYITHLAETLGSTDVLSHEGRIIRLLCGIHRYHTPSRKTIDSIWEAYVPRALEQFFRGSADHGRALGNYLKEDPVGRLPSITEPLDEVIKNTHTHLTLPMGAILHEIPDGPTYIWDELLYRGVSLLGVSADIVDGWQKDLTLVTDKRRLFIHNYERMCEVERMRPGACGRLLQKNNIRHFARYPIEFLVALDDDNEYPSKFPPDAMLFVAFSHTDSSGDHHKDIPFFWSLLNLRNDLTAQAFITRIRVVEFSDTKYLLRQIIRTKAFQADQTVVMITTHGNRTNATINGLESFHRDFLENASVRHVLERYLKGSTVILNSCKSGRRGGLAQRLSKLDIRTFGLQESDSFESIQFQKEGDHVEFIPLAHDGAVQEYVNGELVATWSYS